MNIWVIIWVFIVLDSIGAVICKFNKYCLSVLGKMSFLSGFQVKNSNWPFVYLSLSTLGLLTAMFSKNCQEKIQNCGEEEEKKNE